MSACRVFRNFYSDLFLEVVFWLWSTVSLPCFCVFPPSGFCFLFLYLVDLEADERRGGLRQSWHGSRRMRTWKMDGLWDGCVRAWLIVGHVFGETGAGPSVFVPSEVEPQACGGSCMFACIRVCLRVAQHLTDGEQEWLMGFRRMQEPESLCLNWSAAPHLFLFCS